MKFVIKCKIRKNNLILNGKMRIRPLRCGVEFMNEKELS